MVTLFAYYFVKPASTLKRQVLLIQKLLFAEVLAVACRSDKNFPVTDINSPSVRPAC